MTTIAFYNHTRRLFANNEVNLADLKVMLLNGHTFDAAHTNISSISGDEVSGNGWTAGGEPIDNATVSTVNTNEAVLDGDDISVNATSGPIGPATAAVIYQDTTSAEFPLWFIDFEGSEEAGDGTPFNINWHANGIARWLQPA